MKHTTMSCDHCGKPQGPRVDVFEVQMRIHGKERWEVDLCTKCWEAMVAEYQIREYKPRNRSPFTVTDLDSIPTA